MPLTHPGSNTSIHLEVMFQSIWWMQLAALFFIQFLTPDQLA